MIIISIKEPLFELLKGCCKKLSHTHTRTHTYAHITNSFQRVYVLTDHCLPRFDAMYKRNVIASCYGRRRKRPQVEPEFEVAIR